MNDIIDFLKNDLRGLIILAVVSSLLAALFYDSLKKMYKIFIRYKQKLKSKKEITRMLESYSNGYTAGYAWKSSYHQNVLTGHYMLKIISQIGIIIFSTIFFVAALILIGQPFSWIIVIMFSIVLTLQYRRYKDLRKNYSYFMEHIFGEDFKKSLQKSSVEHVKTKFSRKKKNKPEDH